MIAVGYTLANGLRDDDPAPERIGPVAWLRGRVRFPAEWAIIDCPSPGCGDGWSDPVADLHDWSATVLPIGEWQRGESGRSVDCDRCGWTGMVTRPPVPWSWWWHLATRRVFGSSDPWAGPSSLRARIGRRLDRNIAPF